jgi:hypothetical protein
VDNNILTKTLLGSPFKPPFLGVVIDLQPIPRLTASAGMLFAQETEKIVIAILL